ncbi:MAG TPA: TlpA disulfide reductase family protein [Chitinophagaceae bacterium]|nr:TlpA disulfide reductase family protein [Chitinophagaceae bacterium]
MRKSSFAFLVFTFIAIKAFSQTAFSYTPQNPKPGDVISFTYEPAGTIAGTAKPVEAAYYMLGYAPAGVKNINAEDIKLTRNGKNYTGTVTADTAASFIYFGFSSDKKFDNNFNEGYYIVLNEGDKPRKGAYNALSYFYQFFGTQVGVERNSDKAIEAIQKEITNSPDDKKTLVPNYLRLINSAKKPEASALIQKEIESALKGGLKTEEDYAFLENLYNTARLPEQTKMITSLKKEKYPKGKWIVNETIQKFYMEGDLAKKEALLSEITAKVASDEAWKEVKTDNLKLEIPYAYYSKKDWDGFKKSMTAIAGSMDKSQLASLYNNVAWEMQKTSADLKYAEEMSRFAIQYTKAEMTKPTGKKPMNITSSQWEKQRKSMYGMYADTYAMILYRMGDYKKGLPYAKEAALLINESNNPEENYTYALLAEKVLPPKQYKTQLEGFVKNGKATGDIKDILKRAYSKEKGSEAGFDDYITALQKENYVNRMAELRKSMLNETAPSFALLDMDGKNVSIQDLKGKVVVVDFWATWCGPCKASFPGMQKMVNKYKDDGNVKFVFIDTWEKGDDKKKAAADFITSNKYTFHVLMDNDDKVVEQFKVEGIPTKFVIDKSGIIRFKSVGFDGSDDKLIEELTAMISIASEETKKAF